MKQCATCGEFKDESEYNFRNKLLGKRWGTCRTCQNKQQAKWYDKNKETHKENVYARKIDKKEEARDFIWQYLSTHSCVDCGEGDPLVLEFDHRGNKKYEVSSLVSDGYPLSTIQREIAKCDVVCRNCHVRRTHKQQNTWRGKR